MASEQAISGSLPLPREGRGLAAGTMRQLLARHAPLAAVLAISAALNSYALAQNGYANTFYSAAVKSMLGRCTTSSSSPLTPAASSPSTSRRSRSGCRRRAQRSSASRPLSLLVPEAVAGVLAVGVLYWIARAARSGARPRSPARFALAVFPSFVAVSRDNGPDPLLILLMTLACLCARCARLRAGASAPLL